MNLRVYQFIGLVLLLLSCSDSRYRAGDMDIRDYYEDERVIELAVAAREGNLARVDELIAEGVDVNAVGKQGMTPLLWTLLKGKKGFEHLLKHGANPNYTMPNGDSVIYLAAEIPDSYYLETALAYGGDPNYFDPSLHRTVIFSAIIAYQIKNVEILIRSGTDLNFKDGSGSTPLMMAASLNSYDITYLLLEAGADFTITNNGKTIVYPLENNGIDPNNRLYEWRQKVIAFLRERGVEVNPKIP